MSTKSATVPIWLKVNMIKQYMKIAKNNTKKNKKRKEKYVVYRSTQVQYRHHKGNEEKNREKGVWICRFPYVFHTHIDMGDRCKYTKDATKFPREKVLVAKEQTLYVAGQKRYSANS